MYVFTYIFRPGLSLTFSGHYCWTCNGADGGVSYIYKLSIRSAAPLLCLISLALFVFAGTETETETETETANWAKVSNDHFEGFKMGDSQAAAT